MSKKNLRRDLLLIAALLLISAALYFALNTNREAGGGVAVHVDGAEIARYPFSAEGSYALNGGSNILTIADDAAWLTDANCPDSLCVRQGKVRFDGQVITCLPNRLTVTVYGVESEVELILG